MICGTLVDQGKYSEYPPVDVYGEPLQKFMVFEATNWVEASQIRNDVFGYGPYTKMTELDDPADNWPFRRYVKLTALQWTVPLEGNYYRNITSALDSLWDTLNEETKMHLNYTCLLGNDR